MSHMQQQITEKQRGWRIETSTHETYYVPGDVLAVPAWLATGASFSTEDRTMDMERAIYDNLNGALQDYVESNNGIREIEVVELYFCRLSAPGYLDCTEWCGFATKKEAREYLRDL